MDRRTFSRQLIAGLAALPVWNLAYGNNPEPGRKKVIVIGADSHVIQGEPLRDRERLIWTLDLRPA